MSEKESREKHVIRFGPELFKFLSKFQEIELEDVAIEAESLEFWIQPTAVISSIPTLAPTPTPTAPKVTPIKAKPTSLLEVEYTLPVMEYPGKIMEVKLGATRSEGGTRGKVVVVGGETTPAFYIFEKPMPHPPVISVDVFDTKIPLPKAVKMHIAELWTTQLNGLN